MKKYLLVLALTLGITGLLLAQETKELTALSLLSEDQKTEFGLKKLDESEYKKLDKWTTTLLLRAVQQTIEPAQLEGATIIASDGEDLGKITTNTLDDQSVGNEFAKHGSKFDDKSFVNKLSKYGDKFSNTSAFCTSATKPPAVVLRGKAVGYLTVNRTLAPRVDPYAVIGYCKFSR